MGGQVESKARDQQSPRGALIIYKINKRNEKKQLLAIVQWK